MSPRVQGPYPKLKTPRIWPIFWERPRFMSVAARHMRQLRPGLDRASPVILGKCNLFSPKTKSNLCLLICQA